MFLNQFLFLCHEIESNNACDQQWIQSLHVASEYGIWSHDAKMSVTWIKYFSIATLDTSKESSRVISCGHFHCVELIVGIVEFDGKVMVISFDVGWLGCSLVLAIVKEPCTWRLGDFCAYFYHPPVGTLHYRLQIYHQEVWSKEHVTQRTLLAIFS